MVPLRRPCRLGARRPVPGVLQHQGTGLSPWDAELLAASPPRLGREGFERRSTTGRTPISCAGCRARVSARSCGPSEPRQRVRRGLPATASFAQRPAKAPCADHQQDPQRARSPPPARASAGRSHPQGDRSPSGNRVGTGSLRPTGCVGARSPSRASRRDRTTFEKRRIGTPRNSTDCGGWQLLASH